jgi:hypothetical protein
MMKKYGLRIFVFAILWITAIFFISSCGYNAESE